MEPDISEWGFKFHMNDMNATIGLANLANLPALKLPNGEVVVQTAAILNYIARQGPLKAQSDTDAYRIDEVYETLREIQGEKMKMTYGPNAKENIPGFFKETLGWYLPRLEKYVAKNDTKFIAANYITIADLFFTEMFWSLVRCNEGNTDFLEAYPKLFAVYNAVLSNDKLKAYYDSCKDAPNNGPSAAWQ